MRNKRYAIRNIKKAWKVAEREDGGHLVNYINGVTGYVFRRRHCKNPPARVRGFFYVMSDGRASSIVWEKTH